MFTKLCFSPSINFPKIRYGHKILYKFEHIILSNNNKIFC